MFPIFDVYFIAAGWQIFLNSFSKFLRWRVSTSEWIYLVKCVIGAAICYLFYAFLPQYPVYWAIISVVIVFSPDNNKKLAYDRIKSNLLGASIGLVLFFIPLPSIMVICCGVALTILVGIALKLDNTLRTALAALVIVLIQENQEHDWMVPIERVVCVCIGCFIALIITFVFSKFQSYGQSFLKH
ncbi:MAG: FUSC family protein [Weeksellaceae bacterium]|nr:FUSC family protein [Weeksellaceae bacterium]